MFFHFSNNAGFYINKSKTISPIEALGADNLIGGVT
jgi:hypothetical protein